MSISHLLEDFSAISRGSPVALTDVSLEEQKLEAFEKGYQAGWDDSVNAGSEDTRRVTADLAQNLQDLTFTYEEAHVAALAALKPVLDQMVTTVLPALVHETLGLQISEQLHTLVKEYGKQPIEIVTSPANRPALEHMLIEAMGMEITLTEEPSLAEGQVYIRFSNHEREINLTDVLASIEQAVAGFYEQNKKAIA